MQYPRKGWQMGPLLVLVSPCFRKNVDVTCKIGSFLCSLDNLLQINVIVFFFGNQISKWCSFEEKLFLTYFSHFLVTRGKLQKFLQHISHSHTISYQVKRRYDTVNYCAPSVIEQSRRLSPGVTLSAREFCRIIPTLNLMNFSYLLVTKISKKHDFMQ